MKVELREFPTRKRACFVVLLVVLAGLFFHPAAWAGPLTRVRNTSLVMPTNPPTFGFTSSNIFPSLNFTNPLCLTAPPGETNRLFIVEKRGRIVVITNLAAPARTVFMDITNRVQASSNDADMTSEEGLLGLAFHPGYATNGYFYVFYTGPNRYDILSRFQVSSTNANVADINSEVRYIVQLDDDDNHNGGDLHFGPDGYLYVGLGDEGGSYGSWGNCQRIDKDYFAAIMRIDVDLRPGNLAPNPHASLPSLTNYAIPTDNPWVGATNFNGLPVSSNNVRTEFWAVGMRNPWRFSFDDSTGELMLGHVGQDTAEWINIVTKGANCGWNFFEGNVQWTNTLPSGFVRTPPLAQYSHTSLRKCIIGGIVHRGSRVAQLYGSYLYADFVSGEIWALQHSGTNVTQNTVIFTDSGANITAFGVDPATGDPLYCAAKSGNNSQIKRITYNSTTNGSALPPTLADTGAFTNLAALNSANDPLYPAAGIVAYDVNVPFWSDNSSKTRWFSIPNTNLTMTFNPTSTWSFPTGSVWIKNFNLQLTNNDPTSVRRLETRFLVKNTGGAYGAVYRWGGSKTNASLVGEAGLDEAFVIDDGGGNIRTQVWHYPARSECAACHTAQSGYVLGFRTDQLNRDCTSSAYTTNQLSALSDAGYFSVPVTNGVSSLPALASATNATRTLEYRARSYLAANCAQCHQPGGPAGQAAWDARISTPIALAGIINGSLYNNFGNPANHVITPLSTNNSSLFARICVRDLAVANSIQMPPLASNLIDTQAVSLVSAWINSLTFVPVITNISVVGTNLQLAGTNGFYNANYYLRSATNLGLAASNWTMLATNAFDMNGNFSVSNGIDPSASQRFFLIQSP
jgi:glucose/arabinose dehydrogenase